MAAKKEKKTSFGRRLVALRKARGLTQVQLAEAIGSTQRAVSYYETDAGLPPVPVIGELARALGVTTDELLGVSGETRVATSLEDAPETQRAWKQFRQYLALPEKDRRAVLRLINSLAAAQASKAPEPRPRR